MKTLTQGQFKKEIRKYENHLKSDASIDSFRPASHRGPTQPTALSLIRKRSEKSLVEYTPDADENEIEESKSDKIEKIKTRQKSNLAQAEDAASTGLTFCMNKSN